MWNQPSTGYTLNYADGVQSMVPRGTAGLYQQGLGTPSRGMFASPYQRGGAPAPAPAPATPAPGAVPPNPTGGMFARPYGQQGAAPQAPGAPAAPPAPGAAPAATAFNVAPNQVNRFTIDPAFYQAVVATLGNKQMAQPGQYSQGWNSESNPNSRAQAQQWATQMAQALGRPLTRTEVDQLESRALGWGFNPAQPMQPGWEQGLGRDIAAIQAGQNIGQPTFAPASPISNLVDPAAIAYRRNRGQ